MACFLNGPCNWPIHCSAPCRYLDQFCCLDCCRTRFFISGPSGDFHLPGVHPKRTEAPGGIPGLNNGILVGYSPTAFPSIMFRQTLLSRKYVRATTACQPAQPCHPDLLLHSVRTIGCSTVPVRRAGYQPPLRTSSIAENTSFYTDYEIFETEQLCTYGRPAGS